MLWDIVVVAVLVAVEAADSLGAYELIVAGVAGALEVAEALMVRAVDCC